MESTLPETTPDARPQKPQGPRRRRIFGAIALGVLLIGSGITWVVLADPGSASPNAFRFDSIYVATMDPKAVNDTPIKMDMWFTNTEEKALRAIQIVAIVVDTQRNVAIAKSEHRMGELEGRQTRNAEISLTLNISRPYRVDLLVLADGLLVAKGEGGFGGYYSLLHDGTSEVMLSRDYDARADFQIQYLNG